MYKYVHIYLNIKQHIQMEFYDSEGNRNQPENPSIFILYVCTYIQDPMIHTGTFGKNIQIYLYYMFHKI